MVSEFLCECHEAMVLTPELLQQAHSLGFKDLPDETRVMIHPGARYDGYWTYERMLQQVRNTLIFFELLHPGCKGVFTFD